MSPTMLPNAPDSEGSEAKETLRNTFVRRLPCEARTSNQNWTKTAPPGCLRERGERERERERTKRERAGEQRDREEKEREREWREVSEREREER
jgi:hypothetical protein